MRNKPWKNFLPREVESNNYSTMIDNIFRRKETPRRGVAPKETRCSYRQVFKRWKEGSAFRDWGSFLPHRSSWIKIYFLPC